MTTKRLLPALFLAGFLQAVAPNAGLAQEILFVSPTRIELSGDKRVQTVNVTNLSDLALAYVISLQDLVMTENGGTVAVDQFEYSAKRMVRFVPRRFELQPGQRQTIRVMARVRKGTPEGQFHSHMRFLEDLTKRAALNKERPVKQGTASMAAQISYAALIPLEVSHGEVRSATMLQDARIARTADGRYDLTLEVTREGNGQGKGYLDVEHLAPDGVTSTLTSHRTINVYRELDELRPTIPITLPEGAAPGGEFKISFLKERGGDAQPVKEIRLPVPE